MDSRNVSYWNMTAEKAAYPPLEHDIETDILIIGGGISGVTCAYCLAQKGHSPVLIERDLATERNPGKVRSDGISFRHAEIGDDAVRSTKINSALIR